MEFNCNYHLSENPFHFILNLYYFHGKKKYQDIVNIDNKLIKHELKRTLLLELYEIYKDRSFTRIIECYNFTSIFDFDLTDLPEVKNTSFFNDNLIHFYQEV